MYHRPFGISESTASSFLDSYGLNDRGRSLTSGPGQPETFQRKKKHMVQKLLPRDPGSLNLRMVIMEPKFSEEVIRHPNHPLTR